MARPESAQKQPNEVTWPALQHVLAERCRARGMLLIFDEIFAGLWRLGAPSAWERLGVQPDIACYAKLLTGAAVGLHRADPAVR